MDNPDAVVTATRMFPQLQQHAECRAIHVLGLAHVDDIGDIRTWLVLIGFGKLPVRAEIKARPACLFPPLLPIRTYQPPHVHDLAQSLAGIR